MQMNVNVEGRRTTISVPVLLAELVAIQCGEVPRSPKAYAALRKLAQELVTDAEQAGDDTGSISRFVQECLLLTIIPKKLFERWQSVTG